MPTDVGQLTERYDAVYREQMQDLPIVNRHLEVEAVGFTAFDEHELGVLITPWFMNLVLLPGTDDWRDSAQGSIIERSLPSGNCEFTVCRDDSLGTYLTAILFRSVTDFPDQTTARAIAEETLEVLLTEPHAPESDDNRMSRRALFSRLWDT